MRRLLVWLLWIWLGWNPRKIPSGPTFLPARPPLLSITRSRNTPWEANRASDCWKRRTDGLGNELNQLGIPVSWIALSPSGRFAAAQYDSADEHRLTIWDGQSESTILSFTNRVLQSSLDFSADSSKVAIGFLRRRLSLKSSLCRTEGPVFPCRCARRSANPNALVCPL